MYRNHLSVMIDPGTIGVPLFIFLKKNKFFDFFCYQLLQEQYSRPCLNQGQNCDLYN